MSQSDYIHRKRIENQVATKNRIPINRVDNPPILSSQFRTDLRQYYAVNTISNSRVRYNRSNTPNTLIVMDMNLQIPSDACKTYRTCNNDKYNTNTLPNRVPVNTFYDFDRDVPFVNPHTISPYK
jgi:hypothetical protein